MRRMTSIGMFMATASLGLLLVGDRSVMKALAQEDPGIPDAAIDPASETEVPPVSTLFSSALPEQIEAASPLGQLIRLIQAGVDKEVIIAFINNSPRFFELDADGIIYLSDIGTPPEIIEAIMSHDTQLMDEGIGIQNEPAAQATAEPLTEEPEAVTEEVLYDTLAPYGSWVNVEGYGRCWRPTVVVYDRSWQPYCDNGRWVYTDHGWYWMSNYSWGWAAFHYGRWFNHSSYGWCWWPDTVWSPSWVQWRYNSSYCGWAPLPPYTTYRSGVGMMYHDRTVSVGFDFGLGFSSFTFVSTRNFCEPNPRKHRIHTVEAEKIYARTENSISISRHSNRNAIVNRGIPPRNISTVTQQEITPVSVRHSRNRADLVNRVETLDSDSGTLVIRQPRGSRAQAATAPRSSMARPAPASSAPAVTPRTANSRNNPQSNRSVTPGVSTPSSSAPAVTPRTANSRNNPQNNRSATPGVSAPVTPRTPPAVQPPAARSVPPRSTTRPSSSQNNLRTNPRTPPPAAAPAPRTRASGNTARNTQQVRSSGNAAPQAQPNITRPPRVSRETPASNRRAARSGDS